MNYGANIASSAAVGEADEITARTRTLIRMQETLVDGLTGETNGTVRTS
jgi:hypothetical protein